MPKLILVDLRDGRIVAGLVTSLVFNWNRLPIALQTAIICHASEAGFEDTETPLQADEEIVRFIKTHHQSIRRGASDRRRSLRGLWSGWIRRRRVVRAISAPLPR